MAVNEFTKTETGVLASVRETAFGLHKAGLVDKVTMREFDALCLAAVEPLTPDEAQGLRAITRPPG